MCLFPGKAFDTGTLTENGKPDYAISFSPGKLMRVEEAAKRSRNKLVSPSADLVHINGHTYIQNPIDIPCGHCVECRMQKAKEWKVRLCHEKERWKFAYFVTLTYSDLALPTTPEGVPCLCKNDLDKFLDDFRSPYYGIKRRFKFFACGEYGDIGHRPHYHLIILTDDDLGLVPYEFQCYTSPEIVRAWPFGFSQVKIPEPNEIAYVCGYVEKKQADPYFDTYPVKPFIKMSRNLGCSDEVPFKNGIDRKVYGKFGSKNYSKVPRAYIRKLDERSQEAYKAVSAEIGQQCKINSYGAYKTTDEEKIGFVKEQELLTSLEEKRISKL